MTCSMLPSPRITPSGRWACRVRCLRFGFDLNDPTKIVPVELVPITPIGKLVLSKGPTNYFAETEMAMVCCATTLAGCLLHAYDSSRLVQYNSGHVVRGIDFSGDPSFKDDCFPMLTRSSTATVPKL